MPLGGMIKRDLRALLIGASFGLLFVLAFSKTLAQKPHQPRYLCYNLTVASIDIRQNTHYAVITFYQSQRFYKLPRHSVKYRAYFQLLKYSQKTKTPVYVYRRTEYSDTIAKVAAVPSKR